MLLKYILFVSILIGKQSDAFGLLYGFGFEPAQLPAVQKAATFVTA
jgi:hypothetical protein